MEAQALVWRWGRLHSARSSCMPTSSPPVAQLQFKRFMIQPLKQGDSTPDPLILKTTTITTTTITKDCFP